MFNIMKLSNDCETINDLSLATELDYVQYSIHSLSASAAMCLIENYITYFDLQNANLQQMSIYNYFISFDFTQQPIVKLFEIRGMILNNAIIDKEIDQIKCFLRLMSCDGTPISVTDDDKDPSGCFDGYSNITLTFNDFSIVKTISESRYRTTTTSGFSYSINLTYHQLCLILSGDIETNPGPWYEERDSVFDRYYHTLFIRNDEIWTPFNLDRIYDFATQNVHPMFVTDWLCQNYHRIYGGPCYFCEYGHSSSSDSEYSVFSDDDESESSDSGYEEDLTECGDVEANPGPKFSKMETNDKVTLQQCQIKSLEREISKLKKAQEKQSHYLQRQLELEKRNRKKKRSCK
jgi:hypothetical protein